MRPHSRDIEWESIFDSMSDLISVHSRDFRIITANHALADYLGKSRREIEGMKCHEAIHGTKGIASFCPFRNVRNINRPLERQVYDRRLKKYFLLRLIPVTGHSGRQKHYLHIMKDITRQKSAEISLRNSSQLFKALLDNTNDYIMIADREGRPVAFNAEYQKIIKEVLRIDMKPGLQPHKLLPDPRKVAWWDNLHDRVLGGETFRIEYELDVPGRNKRHLELLYTPVRRKGRVYGFTEITRDVTQRKKTEELLKKYRSRLKQQVLERTRRLFALNEELLKENRERKRIEEALKESETRFRAAATSTADLIWEGNTKNNTLLWFGDIDGILGYAPNEFPRTITGHLEHIHPDDREWMVKSIERSMKTGQDFAAEYRIIGGDGVCHYWDERGKAIEFENGKPVKWVGSVTDITEKKKLEEETRQIQARMIHTNKMTALGTLVSGIAHEINNPNSFIMSNAQLLTEIWDDAFSIIDAYQDEQGEFLLAGIPFSDMKEQVPELLRGISEGSDRIRNIIDSLKNFSRPHVIDMSEKFDVSVVINNAVKFLTAQINKTTDRFYVSSEGDIPLIRGNARQLEQVLINLIMNALQALESRNSGIWVSASYDKERNSVVIIVRDEGIGIPAGNIDRIMEPFFTTRLENGGTGLGLSISYAIVKDHGGLLEFSSSPDTGTTARVILPVHE